ncbi:MAG: hypothetical protein KKD01_05940 [Proteobacteria bacterium]|nr:hypothetical protein [Pseudomonadota bacterium]MBU1234379.1 hypothetical protein [Pseudomonadota bacterium]MBU1420133.1 hypothetical protein [Pseudomonadota bacterium]MBU1454253.1 hypothetical protein [Pseudomonadota bacterium]
MAIPRKQRVGIVGIPPLSVMKALAAPHITIYDLDEPQGRIDIETASPFLPRVYCGILRTVIANSLTIKPDFIYIDTGPGKCDCAVHTATVLEDTLPETRIVRTKNRDSTDFGTPLCKSRMGLLNKMQAITASVQSPMPYQELQPCTPTAGFWGVPPRDFSLLSLFPDTTHVYGWARCMENKTPDNLELELHYNPDVPTVFFAQSFCAKTALARHLATKHPHALYLDCDVTAGNSAKAKIQAFLELSGI